MRSEQRDDPRSDLGTAISLAWGYLKTGQYGLADKLLKGCLRIWPEDARLLLLHTYACVEQGKALDRTMLARLESSVEPWALQILLRAGNGTQESTALH